MRARPAAPGTALRVGAAIGLGMTARAAVGGGADFLLALNAGRLRVMGAASNAALLPLRDSNRFTDEFARTEILGRVPVPVFFGACVFDPALDLEALLADVAEAGYAGVANFPTAIHLDGAFRARLEAAGLGFAREVELLRRATARGLNTLAYVRTREEAAAMAGIGVSKLCLNFGWNAGGTLGVPGAVGLEAATDAARRLFRLVRRASPSTLCFVEGGPIVLPRDALHVCDGSRADGYIGGSTLDRLPLEMSVMQTTSAFRTAPLLRADLEGAAREHGRVSAMAGLIGQSEAVAALTERVARLAGTELSLLVVGEPGAGKTTAARAVHVASRRSGPFRVLDAGDPALTTLLFGAVEPGALDVADSTVAIEGIEALPPALRARLDAWIERGVTERFGGGRDGPRRARLVLTQTLGSPAPPEVEALAARLRASRIEVPPLRERPEDVPLLARATLAMLRREAGARAPRFEPRAMRDLVRHDWPGNVRELAGVVRAAAALARNGAIDAETLRPLLDANRAPARPPAANEREWLLDALGRHRFRRGDTAAFLGLSRKTLYNKMRRHGLDR